MCFDDHIRSGRSWVCGFDVEILVAPNISFWKVLVIDMISKPAQGACANMTKGKFLKSSRY